MSVMEMEYHASEDGGKAGITWGFQNLNTFLEILIHPQNPNIIWVAAQGPLWSKGGERGIYKSVDGGISWLKLLEIRFG